MAEATAAELRDFVVSVFGATSKRLKELTTEKSGDATNLDRLLSACSLTLGDFIRVARVTPDLEKSHHTTLLTKGVVYWCEFLKGRDSAWLKSFSQDFYGGLKSLSNLAYSPPATNSNLRSSQERPNTLPDMDRRQKAFQNQIGGLTGQSSVNDRYGDD